jgi:hypothetical protein
LPTERPTRPELAPFDPLAGTLPHRVNHAASTPSPTLAAMRRPHTMSLWFAGLGLLTLVGALFLSRTEDDIPTVDAADLDRQQVGSLQPVPGSTAPSVPGPAPESLEPRLVRPAALDPVMAGPVRGQALLGNPPEAHAARPHAAQPHAAQPHAAQPSPLLEGSEREAASAQEPIGGVVQHGSGVASSWKANHEPLQRGSGSRADAAVKAGASAKSRATSIPEAFNDVASGKASRAKPAAKKPPEAKKPPVAKKPVEPKSPADTEVDFGI